MKRASTFRLHADVQAGLDLISQLQHRPKNKLVNEAVAEYVTRHSMQTEEALRRTLERLKNYKRADPGSERAIEAFADAEASHGLHDDPAEGTATSSGGPVSKALRQLIDA